MKKYIKSILTSRKQLMLLPLMLVSGGIMQAQTAVPDTIYVSFNANTPLPMTYGQELGTVAGGISGTSFNYFYVNGDGSVHGNIGEGVTFKAPTQALDVLKFSATPTVSGGETLGFVANNLTDYFQYANSSNVVFFVSNREGTFTSMPLTVNPAELNIAAKDTSRFYGDENPVTPWSTKDFVFDGFVNGDTEAIFTNSQVNVLPTVSYSAADKSSAPGTYVIELTGGQAANYSLNLLVWSDTWQEGRGLLTVKKAPLTLAVPDSVRLYDDANIGTIPAGELVITVGELKNEQTLEGLFEGDNLAVVHTAVSAAVNKPKSDVGTYSYELTEAATTQVTWRLSNYDIQAIAAGKYEVKKDTITITVFDAYQAVTIDAKSVNVMQKIYGEANPDGYFWLKKRAEKPAVTAPSYAFSKAAEAVNYISATAEGDKGFKVAPLAGYYDYEGKKATEKTEVNLKREKPNQKEDSLYAAKVDNIDKVSSLNYAFKTVDGSFLINQRQLAIWKVIVDRVYGEADKDTTWTFEPNDTDKKRGLTIFDAKYQTTSTPDDIIDFMPKVVVKPVAADNTLHAGSYNDTLQIKVVTEDKSVQPPFVAKDRNYKLLMNTLIPGTKTNDSVRLEVAKAPLIIRLDTIKRAYGSADPEFNKAEVQKVFISYEGFKLDESANNLDSTATVAVGNRIKNLVINNRPEGILPVGTYELTGITAINKENPNYEITIVGKARYQVYPDNSYVMVWTPIQNELIVGDLVRLNAVVKQGATVIAEGSQITYESSNPALIQVEKVESIWYLRAKDLTGEEGVTITARYNAESGQEEALKSEVFKVVRLKNEADYNVVLGNMVFDYDGTPKAADVQLTDLKGLTTYNPIITYDGDPDLPVEAGIYNISIFVKHNGSDLLVRKEKMQIKPREVYVKPKDALISYGEELPATFEYTYSGFIGSDDFRAATAPVVKVSGTITGAGNYTLYVEGGDPGTNYTVVGGTGTLTVSKAMLTIKAGTVNIVYGDEIPELTPAYEGFVGNDNPDVLNFLYTVKTNVKPVNADTYDLVIDCLSSEEDNYSVTLVPGKLTIAKAAAGLQYSVESTTVMVGDSVLLYASCESPAKISYAAESIQIAGLREHEEGVHVIGKSEGVSKVYITIPESTNHLAHRDSVIFNVKLGSVGNESITLQGVGLYPTIVEYNATVVSETPVEAIYVVDAAGKLQKLIKNPEQVIDLSQLRSGYYLVRIVLTNGEAKTVRIIKK